MSGGTECIGRSAGGAIEVANNDFVDELVADGQKNLIKKCLPPLDAKVCHDCQLPNKDCQFKSVESEASDCCPDAKPWLNPKLVEILQLQSNPECRATREAYEGLLTTENLYRQDFNFLEMDQTILNRRKQEMLHKRWTENVYTPIHCEVQKVANGEGMRDLQARKAQLYRQYLEHVNRKGHVFLDVGDPAEYYAFSLSPSKDAELRAKTGPLNDPLLFQEREKNKEDAVMFRLLTGCSVKDEAIRRIHFPALQPLSRQNISCSDWTQMELGQIDSQPRAFSRRKLRVDRNHSNVVLADQDSLQEADDEYVYVNIPRQFPYYTGRPTSASSFVSLHSSDCYAPNIPQTTIAE